MPIELNHELQYFAELKPQHKEKSGISSTGGNQESSTQNTTIINLLPHPLSHSEISVLSKGLNFCPEKKTWQDTNMWKIIRILLQTLPERIIQDTTTRTQP